MEMTAIVREASVDRYGRVRLTIADPVHEVGVDAILAKPNGNERKLIHSAVRITGVSGQVRNGQHALIAERTLAPSGKALQRVRAAPLQSPLYSIRKLFRESGSLSGHSIRMRGRVGAIRACDITGCARLAAADHRGDHL